MYSVLIIYDMRKGMQKNPRRIQFTKGLYGYYYEWDTKKSGRKRKRKAGLLESLNHYDKVGESAILVNEEDLDKLLSYFQSYSDVIEAKAYKVAHEVSLYHNI
ncbi:MAG: hypothetical protein ACFFCD_01355 [Promethearchaeota archaeon]